MAIRIQVDARRCEGVGYCCEVAPALFELGAAPPSRALVDEVPLDAEAAAEEAALLCPTGAITVEREP
jgi:ferredoxin